MSVGQYIILHNLYYHAASSSSAEYEKFHKIITNEPSIVEQHFGEAIQTVKQLEKLRVKKPQQKEDKKN